VKVFNASHCNQALKGAEHVIFSLILNICNDGEEVILVAYDLNFFLFAVGLRG
jgi:hypothetical protein